MARILMSITRTSRNVWEYLKIDDANELRDDYIDETIDRSRREEKKKSGRFSQLLDIFDWYPSHYSEYERRFLKKVDVSVLLFTALSFYTKYLDSSNISNAYVSGMKEELNLHGNELNYFTSFFNIGYCLFQIPLVLLIQKQAFARYLLIACELCWGMCTFGASTAKNANQLYFVRFLIGVSEAASFPGSYVIMSTWYTPDELVRRAGFYNLMSSIGTTSSGLLQSACREHLNGVLGKSGWRWQFIIDGLITLGCVLYGILLFPGTPETTRKFGILSEDDLTFARNRMRGRVAIPKKFDRKTFKAIFRTWQPYLLVLLWVGHHQVNYDSDLKLYIKSLVPEKYSPSAPTNFAAATGVLAGISAFFIPNLSATYGQLPVVTAVFVVSYFAGAVLIKWDVSHRLKVVAYFLEHIFLSGLAPTFYAWAANLCKDSAEKKLFVLALINTLSYAIQAWSVPWQWNIKEAPKFSTAFRINFGFIVFVNVMFFVVWILERYDDRLIPQFTGDRNKFSSKIDYERLSDDEQTNYGSVSGKLKDDVKNVQLVTIMEYSDSRKSSV
ncbi:CIC11C00000005590 [Sungouiella intermedia]|uniref:CIC11C00000005590 n=1 Tax=Sungouiella intermedia TaxID=45354 RepID=A0A1L0BNT2_9ASCO|nr:CIC11C00000005590 [[Candida] intermedia]